MPLGTLRRSRPAEERIAALGGWAAGERKTSSADDHGLTGEQLVEVQETISRGLGAAAS